MFSFFKRKKKKELVSVIEPTVLPHMKPLTEEKAKKFRSDVKSKGIVRPSSRENYSHSSTDSSDDLINTIVAVEIANIITDSSTSYSSDYGSSSCDSSSSYDSGSW